MIKFSMTLAAIISVLITGCTTVKYPVITGQQPSQPVSINTPLVTTDICPLGEKEPTPGGVYTGIVKRNQQLLWQWICADTPMLTLLGGTGKYKPAFKRISVAEFNAAIDVLKPQLGKIDEIATSINSDENLVIFTKIDGKVYVHEGSNEAQNVVSGFIYDKTKKKVVFSYANSSIDFSSAASSIRDNYARLFESTMKVLLGYEKVPVIPTPKPKSNSPATPPANQ